MIRWERPEVGDLLAGISVALVLVPQALAYAQLAGLPPEIGLLAGTLPAIAAAFFVSSPYLQTGPTALTALLVLGALGSHLDDGTDAVQFAALLALMVGAFRVAFGILRLGIAAYFVSRPVLVGFTTGAALLIIGSQLPAVVGVTATSGSVFSRVWTVATSVTDWSWPSIALSALALALMIAGAKIHRAFPAVLVAVGVTWALAEIMGLEVATIGEIPTSWPTLHVDLPWGSVGQLLVPAFVIALVGFAEPSSIARTYAVADRRPWSADREFVSQGVANLVAGAIGSMPVGGSFGRSALNRASGAHTRWSGFVTGLTILLFLPVADLLSSVPKAVLAAVVIGAARSLLRFDQVRDMWRQSRWQLTTAVATIVATIALDPRVDRAILIGLAASVLVHLAREMGVHVAAEYADGHLRLAPKGVLWFASINRIQERMLAELANHPETERVTVDLSGIGRLDLTAAYELADMARDAADDGIGWRYVNAPPHAARLMRKVVHPD